MAVFHQQRIGDLRVHICLRFVVIRRIGRLRASRGTMPHVGILQAYERKHPFAILFCRHVDWSPIRRSTQNSRGCSSRVQISAAEGEKRRPIRPRCVSPRVLTKRNVTLDETCLDGRKRRRTEILLAEKFVDGPGTHRREKHAFRVNPSVAIGRSAANEDGPWSAQGDQFVRVDWKIAGSQRSRILQEIAGHPVILLGSGNVAHLFPKDVPVELRPCFA